MTFFVHLISQKQFYVLVIIIVIIIIIIIFIYSFFGVVVVIFCAWMRDLSKASVRIKILALL